MLAGTADKPKEICVNHHDVANLGRKKSEAVLGLQYMLSQAEIGVENLVG